MSSQDRIAGGTGQVQVGELVVTVTPLTMTEERSLRRQLRKAAEAATTDYFTKCARLLAAMKGTPAAYLEAVREITRLTATGASVSDEQFFEFRESPAGVALELFARGRRATPGLEFAGLTACITEANVDAVMDDMAAVIEGDGPNAETR